MYLIPMEVSKLKWVILNKEHFVKSTHGNFLRVCGYLRPVQQFNEGKQAEFFDRVTFKIEE